MSLKDKTTVLAVAEEDVPDELLRVLPAFIAAAEAVSEETKHLRSDAWYYCQRVFSVLLQDRERFVVAASAETRSALRTLALKVILATSPHPSLRAATILGLVGYPEDAAFLDGHYPDDPTFAKVFRDAAQALRERQKH